jgi:hypothetical protein
VLVAAVAGIIADASIRALPLLDPSRSVPAPAADDTAALMMLPLGNTRTDTAAMHWGTISGRPVVNGYHSYAPLSYHVLRLALEDRDPSVLHALATVGPVVIAVDNHGQDSWTSFVADHPRSVRLRQENNWTLFLLPFEPLRQHKCAPASVPVAAAFTDNGHVNETLLTDASIGTWWSTGHPQRAGDALILDTGSIVTPCEIVLSLGSYAGAYPRALRISTSPDGVAWDTGFVRELGGMTFLAARDDPTNPRIRLPISSARAARFIRLEIERGQRDYPWMVADIAIYGPAEPGLRHTARDARASLTANGSAGDRDAGAAVTRRTDSSSE